MLTLLHGTSSVHREEVFRKGLKSPFLTNQPDLAVYYAQCEVDEKGGAALILEVQVDAKFLRYDGAAMDEPVSFGDYSISDVERRVKRAWNAAAKKNPSWVEDDIITVPDSEYEISLKTAGSCKMEGVIPPAQITELGQRLPEVPNLDKMQDVYITPPAAARAGIKR